MKHLLTILSGLLVALLFARCADDDNLSGGIDGLPERGIVIRLSTGELDTRTQLTSTGDYHHVEEVWAVLYKLEGTDANDLNNYKLKGNPTKLGSMEDGQFVAWNPYKAPDAPKFNPADPDNPTDAEREKYEQELAEYNNKWGGEYGNGKIQGREFVLPESGAMQAGTYRVLCIGFDEASKTVYDLMSSEGTTLNTMIFGENKTLADAKATLTETKAYEEQTGTYQMYGYDGTGELFAGWTEFEFEPDNINIAEVELKRRVAGILCYVTDIPAMIESTEVKGIRLCLNTKANSEIGLCRLDKPWEDFGAGGGYSSEYAGGTTLAYQDLSDWTADGEILKKGEEGNLVMGAYIIPINVVEDNNVTNTLSVQLFGGDSYDYEDGNLGELIKTFNVLNEQGHSTERGETAERYNILPNYIYHIGDKDDDTDEPMSLLGQKITVKPKEWTGETIPVEFPSVPIKVTIENSDDFEGEILDCIGIETVLNIRNAVVHKDWYLTTTSEGVYFKQSDGTYDKSYNPSDDEKNSSDIVPVTIVITDYAKYNDYKTTAVEDDKRPIDIKVMVGSEVQDKIEAEQWNAIIVSVYDDDDNDKDSDEWRHYAAFSRYDKTEGRVGWGFNGLYGYQFLGTGYSGTDKDLQGQYNYNHVVANKAEDWDISAIAKGHTIGYIYDANTNTVRPLGKSGDNEWCLASFWQLYALLETAWDYRQDDNFDAYNSFYLKERVNKNDYINCYWTSSIVDGTQKYAWAGFIFRDMNYRDEDNWKDFFDNSYGSGLANAKNTTNERIQKYYMRPCKIILKTN